jgi:hypothetical protein
MKTTFDDFIKETPKYNKEYLMQNMPRHLEFGELWTIAVNKATNNGKNSATFASVIAIYNNLEKKQPTESTPKDNPKYNYYKKRFDQISWTDLGRKKFYKSLLNQLKEKGDLTQNQWNHLKRLKGHS